MSIRCFIFLNNGKFDEKLHHLNLMRHSSFVQKIFLFKQKRFEDSLDMILFLTDGMPEDSTRDILEELAAGQNLMVCQMSNLIDH